jgi:hypothetical protein
LRQVLRQLERTSRTRKAAATEGCAQQAATENTEEAREAAARMGAMLIAEEESAKAKPATPQGIVKGKGKAKAGEGSGEPSRKAAAAVAAAARASRKKEQERQRREQLMQRKIDMAAEMLNVGMEVLEQAGVRCVCERSAGCACAPCGASVTAC